MLCALLCCVVLSRCVDTPCKSCKRCLSDFSPLVTDPAYTCLSSSAMPDVFRDFCVTTAGRQATACDMAKLGIASSFRGNAARRAGAICTVLSECNSTQLAGCRWVSSARYPGLKSEAARFWVCAAPPADTTPCTILLAMHVPCVLD
jgi:hypothetical protein